MHFGSSIYIHISLKQSEAHREQQYNAADSLTFPRANDNNHKHWKQEIAFINIFNNGNKYWF